MKKNFVPQYHQLFNPVIKALRSLGGSGTIDEIVQKVIELDEIPDEVVAIPQGGKNPYDTKLEYRLAWARTYLKQYGLLENSSRGVWALTPKAHDITGIDPAVVVKTVQTAMGISKPVRTPLTQEAEEPENEEEWKTSLRNILGDIKPDAFERLAKRLLRESGFIQVEVTGQTGDGGIDGKGIVKISGFLSFHVLFQCKRYKGSVAPKDIRDFRGAMQGRADKGLFITTGSFTREAIKEATRDGAPPIDLIDGDQLALKLKEFKLGIEVEQIEKIRIDENWFKAI